MTQDPEEKVFCRENPDECTPETRNPSRPKIVIPDINPEYTPEEPLDVDEEEQEDGFLKPGEPVPVYEPDDEPEGTDII